MLTRHRCGPRSTEAPGWSRRSPRRAHSCSNTARPQTASPPARGRRRCRSARPASPPPHPPAAPAHTQTCEETPFTAHGLQSARSTPALCFGRRTVMSRSVMLEYCPPAGAWQCVPSWCRRGGGARAGRPSHLHSEQDRAPRNKERGWAVAVRACPAQSASRWSKGCGPSSRGLSSCIRRTAAPAGRAAACHGRVADAAPPSRGQFLRRPDPDCELLRLLNHDVLLTSGSR